VVAGVAAGVAAGVVAVTRLRLGHGGQTLTLPNRGRQPPPIRPLEAIFG
jgi:hypothetical protein